MYAVPASSCSCSSLPAFEALNGPFSCNSWGPRILAMACCSGLSFPDFGRIIKLPTDSVVKSTLRPCRRVVSLAGSARKTSPFPGRTLSIARATGKAPMREAKGPI